MPQFKTCPVSASINDETACTIVEAETAVYDETSGAVSFYDADSNLVARLLNTNFLQLPPAP